MVSVHVPGIEILKPLGFLLWWSGKAIFCYVSKVTLGKSIGNGGRGDWLPGQRAPCLEDWNFQSHSRPPQTRDALEVESITSGQWFHCSCPCTEPGSESFWSGEHMENFGRGTHWEDGGSFVLLHIPCPESHRFIISWCIHVKSFCRVWLIATLWTVACRALLPMGFSRQYWNRLPFPPPGDLPNPRIKLASLMSPAFWFLYY